MRLPVKIRRDWHYYAFSIWPYLYFEWRRRIAGF
ncbi:Protein of uncharacterised function (DUF2754) [Salmonella enterica subsp. enterica]|nr:Protein of uncharacterised function (DUF2754) [Salmonella enterica subsp. enterica]